MLQLTSDWSKLMLGLAKGEGEMVITAIKKEGNYQHYQQWPVTVSYVTPGHYVWHHHLRRLVLSMLVGGVREARS